MNVSECCHEKLWIICGRLKIAEDDKDAEKKLPRGGSCFYMCDRCEEVCDITYKE